MLKLSGQASVPRDVFPPTPPGPEGSNGNGLLRVQWVSGAWLNVSLAQYASSADGHFHCGCGAAWPSIGMDSVNGAHSTAVATGANPKSRASGSLRPIRLGLLRHMGPDDPRTVLCNPPSAQACE